MDTGLASETTRYMVSPVVIAMWRTSPAPWATPTAPWAGPTCCAPPKTPPSSGAIPHRHGQRIAGHARRVLRWRGVTRGLTQELATRQRRSITSASSKRRSSITAGRVGHHGAGRRAGPRHLDAFVVQEQMVCNTIASMAANWSPSIRRRGPWADHRWPAGHPARTDEERLAYRLFADYLLTPEAQKLILDAGYRPTDLSIRLNVEGSPIAPATGPTPPSPAPPCRFPRPR